MNLLLALRYLGESRFDTERVNNHPSTRSTSQFHLEAKLLNRFCVEESPLLSWDEARKSQEPPSHPSPSRISRHTFL